MIESMRHTKLLVMNDNLIAPAPALPVRAGLTASAAIKFLKRMIKRANYLCHLTWSACVRPIAGPGSLHWLIGTEYKYGGMVTNVCRNKVSPRDPRTPEQLKQGGMIGGDRMLFNGYGPKYAQYLKSFVAARQPVTVAEFGILRGTGLALWSDLFPASRIIGFDIDLDHFRSNLERLKQLGAFRSGVPELHEYDQFVPGTDYLRSVLGGDRIDICIDDGFHSSHTILTTFESVRPSLADRFVYFIEDNRNVHKEISRRYPELTVDSCGLLTVVTSGDRGR